MENLEQIRFDGCGSLDNLEICHETEDENFKRLFFRIPSLFLGASVANPQCRLKSIEIDAGDSRRASSLLTSVQSALSVGYSKLEMFSLKFDGSYHSEDGFHLLSDIKQLVNTQPHLYTVNVSFPEKLPSIGDDVETVEGYTEFIMVIEKYMQRPHFECLILRDLLTFERAKQIIHTFLSLPLSSDTKLLDIPVFIG